MRKETSAAIIAGIVSALPVGALWGVVDSFLIWRIIPTLPNQQFRLSQPMMMFLSGFMILFSVAMAAFFGLVAGLIFVKGTIKLPIRSNYIKAVIPVGVLGVMWLLYLLWSTWGRVWSASRYLAYYFASLVLPVGGLAGLGLCTLLFAYLFNRWTKTQSDHMTTIGKIAFCPECGTPISSDTAKFCVRCGKLLPIHS